MLLLLLLSLQYDVSRLGRGGVRGVRCFGSTSGPANMHAKRRSSCRHAYLPLVSDERLPVPDLAYY